jgi:hypothetical protein
LTALFKLYDADGSKKLSLREIKDAICAGRNLHDDVWMAGVKYNFDEKAMQSYKNLSSLAISPLNVSNLGNDTTVAVGGIADWTMDTNLDFT